MSDKRAIGIFDSGLGGLTVLKTLYQEFPTESFLYLGDLARLPYGNKSPETIRRYGEQVLDFLISKDVKLLIIACNTASTVFLGEEQFKQTALFNVIGPGSEAALKKTKNNKIAVLGTSTTIASGAYGKTLRHLSDKVEVIEKACPLLVPLAEEGWIGDPVTGEVIKRYTEGLKAQGVDTVVLGCTHYPILKNDIQTVLPGMNLIESGEVLAERLKTFFIHHPEIVSRETQRTLNVMTTDMTETFLKLARSLMHPHEVRSLERVVL